MVAEPDTESAGPLERGKPRASFGVVNAGGVAMICGLGDRDRAVALGAGDGLRDSVCGAGVALAAALTAIPAHSATA